VTLVGSHKRALHNAFKVGPLGIHDAVQPNYDLIIEKRHWQAKFISKIVPVHDKGLARHLGEENKNNSMASYRVQKTPFLVDTAIVAISLREEIIVEKLNGTPLNSSRGVISTGC